MSRTKVRSTWMPGRQVDVAVAEAGEERVQLLVVFGAAVAAFMEPGPQVVPDFIVELAREREVRPSCKRDQALNRLLH